MMTTVSHSISHLTRLRTSSLRMPNVMAKRGMFTWIQADQKAYRYDKRSGLNKKLDRPLQIYNLFSQRIYKFSKEYIYEEMKLRFVDKRGTPAFVNIELKIIIDNFDRIVAHSMRPEQLQKELEVACENEAQKLLSRFDASTYPAERERLQTFCQLQLAATLSNLGCYPEKLTFSTYIIAGDVDAFIKASEQKLSTAKQEGYATAYLQSQVIGLLCGYALGSYSSFWTKK